MDVLEFDDQRALRRFVADDRLEQPKGHRLALPGVEILRAIGLQQARAGGVDGGMGVAIGADLLPLRRFAVNEGIATQLKDFVWDEALGLEQPPY